MRQPVHGILLLDKPANITSNGALQKAKRLFNAKKAGHTGSLDPIATGMLPICFGEATKFSQFLLEANKSYHVVAKLGIETATGDAEGDIVAERPLAIKKVTPTWLKTVMGKYLGDQEQIPPMHSAIKYQGKPLYSFARRGIEISRHPRRITIFSICLEKLEDDCFTFQVHCSKGTYIRTLVTDIGRELLCGAHVVALRRLGVSPYGEGDTLMHTFATLESKCFHATNASALLACLLPVETAVKLFPAVTLSTAAAFYLKMGQPVRAPFGLQGPLVRLLSEDARFLGVGEVMPDGRVKPHRLIAS